MSKVNEIISKIKDSIPFLKKGGSSPSDDTNLDETSIEEGPPENQNDSTVVDNNKSDKKELTEEDRERKKKVMIIVVLAMAFFLFGPEDEELEGENKTNTAKKVTRKSKKESPEIRSNKEGNIIKDKSENNSVDSTISNTPPEIEAPNDEFVIPDEKVNTINLDPVVKAPEKLSDLTNYDNTLTKIKNDGSEKQNRAQNESSPFEGMPQVQDLNLNDSNLPNSGESDLNPLGQLSEKLSADLNVEKKIEVNYDSLGRGLAYNCVDGYWVCLNKIEYLNCRDSLKWANKLGNNKECVPQDVFAAIKDCQIMQVHNVNTNAPANFCK